MATQLPAELSGTTTKGISAKIPEPLKTWFEEEAIKRSEPGNIVRPSDLYREALAQYANARVDGAEAPPVELNEEA